VAIGIRPAARQAAHDLPPDEQERFVQRAMKRCSRQKWLIKSQQDKADAVVASPTSLSANVRKGSDVLTEVLAEDSRATRIGLSAAARKAAETLAKMLGSKAPPPLFQLRRAKPDDEGEKSPVTQASACVARLIHALPWRCSRRLFRRMLD
jgi:hypothetical protein